MPQCGFCGKRKTVEAAMNSGWFPDYWFEVNGKEVQSDQAICPRDMARHCHDPGNTGEPLVRRGHERYIKHDPKFENEGFLVNQRMRYGDMLRKLRGRGRR